MLPDARMSDISCSSAGREGGCGSPRLQEREPGSGPAPLPLPSCFRQGRTCVASPSALILWLGGPSTTLIPY